MLESSDEEDVENETLNANKKSPTPTEKKNLGNNRKYVLLDQGYFSTFPYRNPTYPCYFTFS